MSKSKTLNHSESNKLQAALAEMDQPAPSAALDQNILATINQKLAREHNAQAFEALVKNPAAASEAQLPASVINAAMLYHAIANNIAEDPALSASDIQARQQALLGNISDHIKSGSNIEQKPSQTTSDLAANITVQNQDAGLSS